jgi:hypothetical protein
MNNPDRGEGPSWLELLNTASQTLHRASARVSAWFEENREGIGRVAEGLALIAVIQPQLERLWERWGEDSEWGYLIWQLDFINGLALMLLLDHTAEDEVVDFLESALGDTDFITRVQGQLAHAKISEPQRRQLVAGLNFVGEREYEAAVPLLIIALEGAFLGEAERRDLVARAKSKMRFTETSGRRGNVRAVEELFEPLGLDEKLTSFLQRQVYGGRGNAFRHGSALDGWREKALTLTIALVAFLDLGTEQENSLLLEAFGRQQDSLGEATERIRARAALS